MTARHGEAFLAFADYMPLSLTALADDGLRERLHEAATGSGHSLFVAHGGAAKDLPYAGSPEPIWTDRPVRVDRVSQRYERVPGLFDPFVTKIRIKPQAQALDGGSFRQDGMIFIIADVVAPDPKRICLYGSSSSG